MRNELQRMSPEAAFASVADDHLRFADVRRRLKAIFIGSIGNLVEWYDFYAYTAFALYFANSFFPGNDPVIQQLNAAVLFAIGFIMRPIGGWLFGHLADHHGRRNALMFSVLLMCFGSLAIAVMPTYASIGTAAPVLLGLARIVQGLSLGGEYGASATYLTEMADNKHRGFYVSFHYVTLIGGQLFVIGAMLAIIALMMRRTLHETDDFVEAKARGKRESSIKALFKFPREVFIVIGLTMGGTTAFYTYTTYMQKFLKLSVGLNDNQTTWVTTGALIFALCLQPIYGTLSDKIGRKPLLVWFGLMGTVFTIPLLYSLAATKSAWTAFFLIAGAWLIVAGYTSINAVVKAELFPTTVRATGVGLPFAITTSIFGGPAESIALWFKSIGHETWFYYYLTSVIAVSFLVAITMRDTKRYSAIGRHE
jgi:MHS family alpha-ketoglutarate permease-like MFS transporter